MRSRLIAGPKDGRCGAAVIDRYIDVICGEGIINVGDWGQTDGLEPYSGGMSYRQQRGLRILAHITGYLNGWN